MEKIYYSINEIAKLLDEPLYTKKQFYRFQYIHKEIHKNNMSVAGLKKKINSIADLEEAQIMLSRDELKEILTLFSLIFEVLKQEEI